MSKHHGGNAFPADPGWFDPATVAEGRHIAGGMTLRDYFAAKAMSGLVVGAGFQNTNYSETALARSAYEMADAMLKERAK